MKWSSIRKNQWFLKVQRLFQQGLGTREMAMSISLGTFIGVLPLFGISTALVTALAIWFRLNIPIAVFITYAVSPLHVLLIIPFIRLGELFYGVEHSLITVSAIKQAFQSDIFNALKDLAFQIFCGLTGWLAAGIPSALVLFFILYQSILFFRKRSGTFNSIS